MSPVAWIVGGARGLGVVIARELAEDGYRIAVNYRRSRQAAETLQREIEQAGGKVMVMQGDVSRLPDVRRMAREVLNRWERVDVLVCAAGPFIFKRTPAIALSDQQWREMLDGNLSGVFYCVREVIPAMRRQGSGRIITFGFPEVEQAPAWEGYSAYAAAKAGLVSFTRTLAAEEAPHGITVNMVYPGDIRDPYKEAPISAARGKKDPRNPVGRPGTGGDIARVVRFLAHPDSDLITGAIVPVTGGFTNVHFHVK
ncbi:SDR family oxidoreductase [Paenactinomyces guangxiensis]|uniref:SDR family oxidoreductase n=1 Tax=Paenactinomyces guangxiensis TaxID=1490290 RepID=A0A7W1WRV0_9BACL|nr:SDR family oxidoreductase [Paenactinomyces guangxiensis]MBA4494803.1 SDR family oxidoreductase [Paenactinomyces guangxiensis]MBH8591886.1 SDR family oxidoreductase [Paenactinomyces guangxiensis]